ncbi:MAG: putative lipid II flippase FtsW [Pseudomonadales bacterium]
MSSSLDRALLFSWLALLALGGVMVTSASVGRLDGIVLRHGVYLMLALILFVGALLTPLELWRRNHQWLLLLTFLLCAIVLIPGIGLRANGARRWIGLGAFSIQSGEVAKLLLPVYLAGYLARFHGDQVRAFSVIIRPVVVIALLCGLLILQPDFGTLVVLAIVGFALLFLGGMRLGHYLLLVALGVAAVAALAVFEPYRMQRLISFTNPWSDAFGNGYQLVQSLIAFGRGEVFGLGLGEGIQKLDYLPEAHNDFIFAVIAEELGLTGALWVIAVFALLVLRIFRLGRKALQEGNHFGGYLAYGVGLALGVQFLVNIGVSTGVLPTKGLTLPFVSYGGNSLMVSCAMIGLMLRLQMERSRYV